MDDTGFASLNLSPLKAITRHGLAFGVGVGTAKELLCENLEETNRRDVYVLLPEGEVEKTFCLYLNDERIPERHVEDFLAEQKQPGNNSELQTVLLVQLNAQE